MRTSERVVVDTNVFVSGLLRESSVPGRAAAKARHNGTLLISDETLRELAEVLAKEKFDRYVTIEQCLQFLRLMASIAELVPIIQPVRECRDPHDDKFLELALNGSADVMVTGNSDLLRLHSWRGVAILSPSAFLER